MTNLEKLMTNVTPNQVAEYIANEFDCAECPALEDCSRCNINRCEKFLREWLVREQSECPDRL